MFLGLRAENWDNEEKRREFRMAERNFLRQQLNRVLRYIFGILVLFSLEFLILVGLNNGDFFL